MSRKPVNWVKTLVAKLKLPYACGPSARGSTASMIRYMGTVAMLAASLPM